ncbi:hypothetical protein NKDENANG_00750 [Candidatus Entotheonellaceae bacterium PAL068K]
MAPSFHRVLLTDIALDDRTCVVTYQPDMQDLQRSVARTGVLAPVHLRRVAAQDPLQVVCGWKRLHACQRTGHTHVPALVYEPAELSEEQAFLLALYDNLGCRPFNSVEKGRILRRLRDDFQYEARLLIEEFCPLLGLPPRPASLEVYCSLVRLAEPLQAAVVAATLPLETALWIGRQTPDARPALLALFTGLRVGNNRAREFATHIDEICRRDATTVVSLLQQLGVSATLADTSLPRPQKVEQVRRVLHAARYPQFSAHEQRFRDTLQRLQLPSQLRLLPPPYFEGQHYQVSFEFGSRRELQRYAQRLLDAASGDGLDDLLALL